MLPHKAYPALASKYWRQTPLFLSPAFCPSFPSWHSSGQTPQPCVLFPRHFCGYLEVFAALPLGTPQCCNLVFLLQAWLVVPSVPQWPGTVPPPALVPLPTHKSVTKRSPDGYFQMILSFVPCQEQLRTIMFAFWHCKHFKLISTHLDNFTLLRGS